MNIFKAVDLSYRTSCLELSRLEVNTMGYYVCQSRVKALAAVLGVLKSYSWVKREEVKKKVKFFIENDFSYSRLANDMGITKKSAYVLISRAGKHFEDVIGINVARIIAGEFSIEDVLIKTDSVTNIFIEDLQDHLEARECVGIDLLECMQELTTLKNLTKASINNRLKKLDVEKVSYIVFLLQTDKIEYALEKELLRTYIINGSIKSKDELEIRLKEINK